MMMMMMMMIPQTIPYLEQIGNSKYYEETTDLEKWQSEVSPEY